MGEFLKFTWPLNAYSLIASAWMVILTWLVVTQIALFFRRSLRQGLIKVLTDINSDFGAISVFVTGDHEAVAIGSRYLHWIDCDVPSVSFSLPLDEISHFKVIDEDPQRMMFAFKLTDGLETRVLTTRDILQTAELFRLMQDNSKIIDYRTR
jgi:hypothetical protein